MRNRVLGAWLATIGVLVAASVAKTAELPGGIRVDASVEPTRLAPGDIAQLAVTIQLPAGWTTFDLEQVPNSVLPTTLSLDETDGVTATETFRSQGARERYEPRFANRVVRYFDQSPSFTRPLVISDQARHGERKIAGKVSFLAHDVAEQRYFLVADVPFHTSIVIGASDERSSTSGQTTTLPPVEGLAADIDVAEPIAVVATAPQLEEPKVEQNVEQPRFSIAWDDEKTRQNRETDAGAAAAWLAGLLLIAGGFAWGLMTPPMERF